MASQKQKVSLKDLFKAAKRNFKTAPKKVYFWLAGCGLAIIILLVVWISDLITLFG